MAGFNRNNFEQTRDVSMHGTSAAPNAKGLIKLGEQDKAGNWPMVVTVEGLPLLPERGYYELFLTRDGKLLRCGNLQRQSGAQRAWSSPSLIRSSGTTAGS